ncbi:hypothetical protein XENTR_v10005813 [Xenopus tropicalis]|nr:hypothetical protein XENTR_v10005813 [Xenopus tropicalis]
MCFTAPENSFTVVNSDYSILSQQYVKSAGRWKRKMSVGRVGGIHECSSSGATKVAYLHISKTMGCMGIYEHLFENRAADFSMCKETNSLYLRLII